MSRKLFALLLSELKTIRIVCKCGAAIEMSIVQAIASNDRKCPGCNEWVINEGRAGQLAALATTINQLQGQTPLQIEFILPDKSDKAV